MHDVWAGRPRSQAGLTLMEVLLTVAISGIIAIPVLAWMVVGFRTERVVASASDTTRALNQLNLEFTRDMSSAAVVTLAGSNCAAASPSEAVLVSILNHDLSELIVYVGVVDGPHGQLVRRTCTPAGASTGSETVVEDVALPLSANLVATASTLPSRPGDPAARVDLSVTDRDGSNFRVTGSRRTGSDS